MIRGSYLHRTGYYEVFCIELIPRWCLYSPGDVPPSREHLEKTALQRHSLRAFTLSLPRMRIYSSGEAKDVQPAPGSSRSDQMGTPTLARWHCLRPDGKPAHGVGWIRHNSLWNRFASSPVLSLCTNKFSKDGDFETFQRMQRAQRIQAFQFINCSSNADLLKMIWNLER